MDIVVFGAGKIGSEAIRYHILKGDRVVGILDNNRTLWGTTVYNVMIYEPEKYLKENPSIHVVIGTAYKRRVEIEQQLRNIGFNDYESFNPDHMYEKERIISYCSADEMEDVILYHVLKYDNDIFFIDVGSNDPVNNSVTKWLYDTKNACGINIEPQRKLWELCMNERPRDINLCVGVGEKEGVETLYLQEGGSTICKKNVIIENSDSVMIEIKTLSAICDEYVKDKEITFLKIDVEGYERQVLLGADFDRYRPKIILVESTIPRTKISNYDEWEEILIEGGYHFVYSRGVNRYYVADEQRGRYDDRFIQFENDRASYLISKATINAILV